jgi:hypothetical protein
MDSAPEARRCSSKVVSALWAGAVAVAACWPWLNLHAAPARQFPDAKNRHMRAPFAGRGDGALDAGESGASSQGGHTVSPSAGDGGDGGAAAWLKGQAAPLRHVPLAKKTQGAPGRDGDLLGGPGALGNGADGLCVWAAMACSP